VRLSTAAGELVANVPAQSAHALPATGADAIAHWAAARTVVFPEQDRPSNEGESNSEGGRQ
jgi:hypothetical protein